MTAASLTERPSILLVDDHPANLLALEAVLAPLAQDYDLVRAESGEEALLKSLQRDFVLVLMDVHMPTMDGYETVELLRRRPQSREVPVIFLTAVFNLEEHVHRGYSLGASDFVTKPFDPVVLRSKVASLVSLYMRGRREERARREEMDRLKDLYLGAIGHDLRNPLNTIILGARSLQRDDSDADARRNRARMIERAGVRMSRMVEDILDLTAAKFSGTLPLKVGSTDLAAVCSGVVAELESANPDRSIRLHVSGDVAGEWDGVRLARLVGNLVANALHHAPESRVEVRVVGEGDDVRISVHNDGAPIPLDVLPLLFEPFRRGDTSAEGLGLGLYIVRAIARAHGGDVEVQSSEGRGTTFVVTLPRRGEEGGAAGAASLRGAE